MAAIQQGKALKKVDEVAPGAPPPQEGRDGLMAQIQGGFKLKKAADREPEVPAGGGGGGGGGGGDLASTLAAAMMARRVATNDDDDSDDDDWDD